MTHDHVYPFDERSEVAVFIPPDAHRVLDVGCSLGGFGSLLRRTRSDMELLGVEIDAAAAAEARRTYDRVFVGSYPGAVSGLALEANCIVFNDVLEHIVDPWEALRATRKHLAPGGVVIASIPNIRSLQVLIDLVFRGDWKYREMGILDRTHLRFFTKRSMQRLFTECGYEVLQISGIFPLGTRWHLARVTTRLLRDIAYLEFVVVARPDPGES